MRDAIHKEIDKLKTADVTDAELEMYKTRARADLLRGLADNQGLANALAEYQTRYGDWRELFLQLDQVDKVTKADIRRVANQVFVAANRTSGGDRDRGSCEQRKSGRRGMSGRDQKSGVRDQKRVNSGQLIGLAIVGGLSLGMLAPFAARAQQSKPWEKIPIPPLHAFQAAAAEADRAEERHRAVSAGGS